MTPSVVDAAADSAVAVAAGLLPPRMAFLSGPKYRYQVKDQFLSVCLSVSLSVSNLCDFLPVCSSVCLFLFVGIIVCLSVCLQRVSMSSKCFKSDWTGNLSLY